MSTVNIETNDLDSLIRCMYHYSVPRHSYVVEELAYLVGKYRRTVSTDLLLHLRNEILNDTATYTSGMWDIDKSIFLHVAKLCEEQLKARGVNYE